MLKILLSLILALGFPFMALADTNSAANLSLLNSLGTNWTTISNLLNNTGVLNAQNGAYKQVVASGQATASTTTIWTVDTGHTLYIGSFLNNGLSNFSNGSASCELQVTNSGGTVMYHVSFMNVSSTASTQVSISDSRALINPIIVPSAFIIKEVSVGANGVCDGSITGWEI